MRTKLTSGEQQLSARDKNGRFCPGHKPKAKPYVGLSRAREEERETCAIGPPFTHSSCVLGQVRM